MAPRSDADAGVGETVRAAGTAAWSTLPFSLGLCGRHRAGEALREAVGSGSWPSRAPTFAGFEGGAEVETALEAVGAGGSACTAAADIAGSCAPRMDVSTVTARRAGGAGSARGQ